MNSLNITKKDIKHDLFSQYLGKSETTGEHVYRHKYYLRVNNGNLDRAYLSDKPKPNQEDIAVDEIYNCLKDLTDEDLKRPQFED